jgi:caspase domain-containing protein
MLGRVLLLSALLAGAMPAEARRVALIVANARYANAAPLANPVADAKLIEASLRRAGFDDVQTRTNLGKASVEAELRAFGNRAEGADVALFYYAGHGIEAGGQNYLIPTDAKLQRDRDLDIEATRLETVLQVVSSARMRLIILDACRNNPFESSMQRSIRTRAVSRGLAEIEPEGETLVVYAAKAGSTAADGNGANSPFATALARRLPQPGLEIGLLFRAVRDDVLAATGRTQEPFTYGSLSGQAFYFRAAGADANTTGPAPQPQIDVAPHAPSAPARDPGQPQQAAGRPDLATTLEGVWYGDVISDSKGSSRSDVIVTIRRTSRNTIAITSDYARLPAITVTLTRAMQTILAADGDTIINYDLAKDTKQLGIVFKGEVAWSGVRSGGNQP